MITGSGSGIGRATALRMASLGAVVGVNDLKQEAVEAVVAEIKAAGGNAVAVAQDVSTRDGMRAAVLGFAEQQGRLDILVNNAAWVRYQSVPDIAPETVERMLNIGFKAIIWGIQAAAEVMDRRTRRRHHQCGLGRRPRLRQEQHRLQRHQGGRDGHHPGGGGGTRRAQHQGQCRRAFGDTRPKAPCETATPNSTRAAIARTPLGRLGTVEDIASARSVSWPAMTAGSYRRRS